MSERLISGATSGVTSTKPAARRRTYTQNLCRRDSGPPIRPELRYQTHSKRKSLIYIGFLNCHFSGQFKESLDLQGFAAPGGNLSTKLSTENRDIFKVLKNQGLSAFFVCNCEEIYTFRYTK
ncbi:MAG: hypothetical protein MUP33_04925 [Polaromonas sp.]|nr:hypothetical protein [Polaromonas sp.]